MMSQSVWMASWMAVVLSAGLGAVLVLYRSKGHPAGWALLIAAISLSAAGGALHRFQADPPLLGLLAHIGAALCLIWMLLCVPIRFVQDRLRGGPDVVAIVQFSALTCGMASIILFGYVVAAEVAYRLFAYGLTAYVRPAAQPAALVDVAAVAIAAGIGLRLTGERSLLTLLFWLAVFAAVWIGLLYDPIPTQPSAVGPTQIPPTDWTSAAIVCAALVLFAFAVVDYIVCIAARRRAWPEALDTLTIARPSWPGFRISAGLVALAVLVAGCLLVMRPGTAAAAALAAAAVFLLTARSWSETLAETATVLVTLSVVSLATLGLSTSASELARFPLMLERFLPALAVMAWFWYWLAAVWEQQRDHRRAWTTAGRMIPTARRVGFFVGAIGVLVAMELASWPRGWLVTDPDRSPARWVWGMVGLSALFAALAHTAVRRRASLAGWLSMFAAAAAVVFVHYRTTGTQAHLWAVRRAPLLLACAGPAVAMLPRLFRLRPSNPFNEILTVTGAMALPAAAMAGIQILEDSELAGRHIVTSTLAILAGWYAVLSLWPQWRGLLWIALALANLAGIDLWNQCGASVPLVTTTTIVQVMCSGWLLTWVYWADLRTPATRLIAILTAPAAGVLAGILVGIARRGV